MKSKILQIIPVSRELYVAYRSKNTPVGHLKEEKVILRSLQCYALVSEPPDNAAYIQGIIRDGATFEIAEEECFAELLGYYSSQAEVEEIWKEKVDFIDEMPTDKKALEE